jgi:hypothetical protein
MKSIILTSLLFLFTITVFGQSQDSSVQRQELQKKQKMDRFIDEDGDGICDRRADGLGFGRQKKMHGKKQQAVQSRQGTVSGSQGENKGSRRQGGKK